MNIYRKIEGECLDEYIGQKAELYCQVGVVCSITGKLERAFISKWQVRMSNDQTVGFSFGEYKVLPNGTVSIRVC